MLSTILSLLLIGPLAIPQTAPVPSDDGFTDVTVPTRADSTLVHLTSASPAAVLETRSIRLRRGTNRLRFDWSTERIDEASVRIDVTAESGTAKVVSRRKVQRLGQMLYFDVEAAEDTMATLSTRYLLYGIGWRVDYVGVQGADPAAMSLRLGVEVQNNSGKDLDRARVSFEGGLIEELSLRSGRSRGAEVFRLESVPFTKRYVYDPMLDATNPRIELELENSPHGPLGRELLPAGKIRVFTAAGDGGPALLGEDVFPATALGEKAKFSIGHARDLVVRRTVLSQGNENERRDRWNKVVAYDQRTKLRLEIDDGLGRDETLTLVERPGAPHEVVSCTATHERKNAETVEIRADLRAGQKTTVELEWVRRNLF